MSPRSRLTRPLRTRALSCTLLAALATLLAGCGAAERSRGGVTPEQRRAALPLLTDEFRALGYQLEWRGSADVRRGETVQYADVLGDILAIQDTAGFVFVLQADNGISRWSDELASRLTRFVGNVRVGDRLIVSSDTDAYFLALDTGTLVDRQRLRRVVNTKPAPVGDLLVYGTATGHILGHLTLNGFPLWGQTMQGSIDVDPVMVGDDIGFVSQTGDVMIISGASGNLVGRNRIGRGSEAPTAASDTSMFIASLDQSLYAISRDGGNIRWRKRTDTPLRSRPVYHDGRVYCFIPGQGLTAFDDANRGAELWSAPEIGGYVVGIRDGRLMTWDGRTAAALDAESGQVIERVSITGGAFLLTDRFVDGALYLIAPNGAAAKYTPR